MHLRTVADVEGIGDLVAGRSTGLVAVEHQDDAWGLAQQLYPGGGEMDPEQGDGRNADLGQAHDAPGTLHHRQALMQARSDAVETVEG